MDIRSFVCYDNLKYSQTKFRGDTLYKLIMPYLGKYKKDVILSVICSTVESFFDLSVTLLMAYLLDYGIGRSDMAYTLKLGCLMIGIGLLVVGMGILSVKFSTRAGMGFGAELRKAQYKAIQGYTFKNIETFGTGSLINRLTGDVTAVQSAICTAIKTLARAPSMIIIAFIMSFMVNKTVALLFLAIFPAFVIVYAIIIRKLMPRYKAMQESIDSMNLITQENLTGMGIIKAFVRRDQQKQRFGDANNKVFRSSDRAFGFGVLNGPFSNLIMYAVIIAMYRIGGDLIIKNYLSVGELTSLISYLNSIMTQTLGIGSVFLVLSRSLVSLRRISEVLAQVPDIEDGPVEQPVADGSIKFENVSFRYGESGKYILQNIDLTISSGETIGIIGGTGSAKSTLVNLIPRLYDVSDGCIKVGDRDIREYTLKTLRDGVSIVLQQNTLFSGTIRENLRWGDPGAEQSEMDTACSAACATEFISRLPDGYDTVLSQGGVNLSGGQRQRLCIARALMKKPKVLILDDSTSAVDMATDAAIRKSFKENLSGVTKLIIAQRIASVMDADRIIVIDEGRITAIGSHNELMESSDIYRTIYKTQQEGALING